VNRQWPIEDRKDSLSQNTNKNPSSKMDSGQEFELEEYPIEVADNVPNEVAYLGEQQ
jgi:hypothetical protein